MTDALRRAGERAGVDLGYEQAHIPESAAEQMMSELSLYETVSQMFFIAVPDGLSTSQLEQFAADSAAGGFILFSENSYTADETRALTQLLKDSSGIAPFIGFGGEDEAVSGLRERGLIITDAMNMGAATSDISCGEAAVASIAAGADIILMPRDFHEAVAAVMSAIENGVIPIERIHESAEKILLTKINSGII